MRTTGQWTRHRPADDACAFSALPGSPPELRGWRGRLRLAVRTGTASPWLVRDIREQDRRLEPHR